MIKKNTFLAAILISFTMCAGQTTAQVIRNDPPIYQPVPDSPILSRNSALSGEGKAFDFLIGDWDAVITWEPDNGPKDTYRAQWHNHWIIDGYAVMQEWRGPSMTGAEIRFYDVNTKSWKGQNIYVDGAWRKTKAKSDGDTLVVTIFSEDEKQGKFLNRETYFNITDNSFLMKSDLSFDDGETWKKGNYHMRVTRSVE